MVTLTRFDEVTALDVAEQRRLLRTGTPEQQVWAAWALGLELGERAVPELCIALDRDEDAGVRRHLVVILAGLGERALLDELSMGEVDEAVRATAAQYALQTGERTRLRPAIAALLRDPSARVRRALLVAKREGGAVLDTDDLATLVADPDAEVRELAIEALARVIEPERLFPGVLEDRLAVEPESYLRRLLMRLAVAGGRARRLLALGLTAPPSLALGLTAPPSPWSCRTHSSRAGSCSAGPTWPRWPCGTSPRPTMTWPSCWTTTAPWGPWAGSSRGSCARCGRPTRPAAQAWSVPTSARGATPCWSRRCATPTPPASLPSTVRPWGQSWPTWRPSRPRWMRLPPAGHPPGRSIGRGCPTSRCGCAC